MPGLTVETDSTSPLRSRQQQQQSPHSTSGSRSSSPIRPPYSPITPVLGPVHLSTPKTPTTSNANQSSLGGTMGLGGSNYPAADSCTPYIPAPKPLTESVSFSSNPDVIAVRAAMSVLQIQRQKAIADMQVLQQIKERAMTSPTEFATALASGKISTKTDDLFPSISPNAQGGSAAAENGDIENRDDDDTDTSTGRPIDTFFRDGALSTTDPGRPEKAGCKEKASSKKGISWPDFPKPQNVVRTPPINWAQYAIIGESLDKLHADQVARPNEGSPAKVGPHGEVVPVESPGKKQLGLGVAAPYMPGRDKIDKPSGTKRGNKR